MHKNVLLGIGNILFCDDGIGVYVAQYLQKNYSFSPSIEIVDGGTLGINLMQYFAQYDNVLIIDTISLNDSAGSIFRLPSKELLGLSEYKNTAHEVEVIDMLQSAMLLDKQADVTIFGIIPEDINSVKIGLSLVLEKQFFSLLDSVIEDIQKLNIEVKKTNTISLKEIIKNSYNL